MKDRFTTIAVFQYTAEALIIKGKLESEGVEVFLVDEYTVDTDPLVSNAIGGVKLQVYSYDEEKARLIVKQISPELLKEEVVCTSCSSKNIKLTVSLSNLLLKLFPVGNELTYTCIDCSVRFKGKEI